MISRTGCAGEISLGQAVAGVAEVFTPSATRRMELSAEAQMAALQQFVQQGGAHKAGGANQCDVHGVFLQV